MEKIWQFLVDGIWLFVSGALGSVIHVIAEKEPFKVAVTKIVIGTITAGIFGNAISKWQELEPWAACSVSYVIGQLGYYIIRLITQMARIYFPQLTQLKFTDILSIVKRLK